MKTLLLITALAVGQSWGPRGCPPAGPVGPLAFRAPLQLHQPAPAPLEWSEDPAGGYWYLYRGHEQVGCYVAAADAYRPRVPGTHSFGPACEPPLALPAAARAARLIGQLPPDGVQADRIRDGVYSLNGIDVSKAEAEKAIQQAGPLKDDSTLPRLTVIGPESDRRRLLDSAAVKPYLPFVLLTGRSVGVPGFDPADFQVSYRKMTAGTPSAYLQRPDGTLLAHVPSDADLGPLVKALQPLDPLWKPPAPVPPVVPPKTPDQPAPGPKVDPQPAPAAPDATLMVLIGVIAGVLGLLNLLAHLRRPPEKP